MKQIKNVLRYIFVDGLAGMALGLFSTLILGTIIEQMGTMIGGEIGGYLSGAASLAKVLTGIGIGVGVACKYKDDVLVTVAAGAAGMCGAYAQNLLSGSLFLDGAVVLSGPGEPLGAFIAALMAVTVGRLISGRTKLDILLTPIVTFLSGSAAGLFVGPPISGFMALIGDVIESGTRQQPLFMGIVVSVLMGICLTLPISSAAIGVILNLSGLPAGAATAGCCAQMVGFAVASYEDNKVGGLLAQGIGTSMLQMPNIVRKPIIWIPPILTSAILGPISTVLLKMTSNSTGSGMGTAGLIGPIMCYQTMVTEGANPTLVLIEIAVMYVIAPALLTLVFANFMKNHGFIKMGDMKLPS
ncbi:MAG: PTS sugar transporter subunit IIC [Lachnospiraceae bacterium]|nr:PTS sugar transporter subunit IIC [Lachnospiraceae bacterium]